MYVADAKQSDLNELSKLKMWIIGYACSVHAYV